MVAFVYQHVDVSFRFFSVLRRLRNFRFGGNQFAGWLICFLSGFDRKHRWPSRHTNLLNLFYHPVYIWSRCYFIYFRSQRSEANEWAYHLAIIAMIINNLKRRRWHQLHSFWKQSHRRWRRTRSSAILIKLTTPSSQPKLSTVTLKSSTAAASQTAIRYRSQSVNRVCFDLRGEHFLSRREKVFWKARLWNFAPGLFFCRMFVWHHQQSEAMKAGKVNQSHVVCAQLAIFQHHSYSSPARIPSPPSDAEWNE